MDSGQSPRFLAILVVFLPTFISTVFCCSPLSSLAPPLPSAETAPSLNDSFVFKRNEKCKYFGSEWKSPRSNFYFLFVSPSLYQILWLIWTFLLLMRVYWQRALEMKRWAAFSVCLSFAPSLSLYWSFFILLRYTYTGVHFHPPRLCCSWMDFDRNMNCFGFCYLSLLKTLSSQHIILGHRCPGLLESAECGPASSDAAAWLTSETLNTHNHCHTQTDGACTHIVVIHQCPASAAHFRSSYLLPAGHIVLAACCCWTSEIRVNMREFRGVFYELNLISSHQPDIQTWLGCRSICTLAEKKMIYWRELYFSWRIASSVAVMLLSDILAACCSSPLHLEEVTVGEMHNHSQHNQQMVM